MKHSSKLILSALLTAPSIATAATTIRVDLTTTGPVGFAPAFAGFHDGTAGDLFNVGSNASAGLEALAEVGDTAAITTEFAGQNFATFAAGGPFVPNGGTGSFTFTVEDTGQGFFSLATMLLPSNDWFTGTDNPINISGLLGAGIGTFQDISLSNVYDGGTEAEDFMFGPGGGLVGIMVPGTDPGAGTATANSISMVTGPDPFGTFANIPGGFDTNTIDFTGSPVGTVRLTVVPEPSSALLMSLAGLGLISRRRRS